MKNIIAIFVILVVVGFSSINVFCSDIIEVSDPAHVTEITFMGELWGNPNRGGFYFKTDNLPSGINYFIVRGGSELYIDRLLATLLLAKSMNKRVVINYTKVTSTEGDVVSIGIE